MVECHDCGLEYGSIKWADVVIPDEIWAEITPADCREGGILCFNCIVGRLQKMKLTNVPFLITSGPLAFDSKK